MKKLMSWGVTEAIDKFFRIGDAGSGGPVRLYGPVAARAQLQEGRLVDAVHSSVGRLVEGQ